MVTRRGVLAGLVLAATAFAAEAQAPHLKGRALVEALAGGGFIIYFRHAQTNWSQSDQVREAGDWLSCDADRMRQLSAQGRDTSRQVGAALRALRVPVATVLASPYCRTVETARLMGLGEVQSTTDVMNMRVAEFFGGRAAIVATARRRLATPPAAGNNTVIVAHGNVARESTPVYPGEAEGVVFRPDGNGSFSVVARVIPHEWEALAREFSAP